jgi:signal transduction histidine kinase
MSAFVDGAKVIAKGDFEKRIPVSSKDEIGELAVAFNDMAGGLKERDVELKKAYQQVIHSEKMAAFGQIGAGITHEIKNPLAGIIGQAMLAMRKLDDESPIAKNIKLIKSETERCLDIVKNLLTFTRQEKAVFEPVDVNHVVETTIRLIAHQLAIRGIDLEQEISEVPGKIHGNGNQLEQVLLNIIINAHDAMDDGGKLKIETGVIDDDKVRISIADNGPGIPEEVRAKIFEPFFTTKEAGKGTGLGLSVSYGIIKEHNGIIEVHSEIGKGTTFLITLPLKSDEELEKLEKERLDNLRKEAASTG